MARIKSTSEKGRSRQELEDFSLGQNDTQYPVSYDPALLEAFENKNPEAFAWTSFLCTEFTSLCPKTNQPDFAKITINYIADKLMVESKSLKLYLFSFRNHGDFHEDCIQKICDDLVSLMGPCYLEVIGEFTPRGGIAIYPYSNYSNGTEEYDRLKQERRTTYAPGKFTMPFNRIY